MSESLMFAFRSWDDALSAINAVRLAELNVFDGRSLVVRRNSEEFVCLAIWRSDSRVWISLYPDYSRLSESSVDELVEFCLNYLVASAFGIETFHSSTEGDVAEFNSQDRAYNRKLIVREIKANFNI